MNTSFKLLAFIALFVLTACTTETVRPVPVVSETAAALGMAEGERQRIAAEERAILRSRDSKVASSFVATLEVVPHIDAGAPKDAVEAEARLGLETLGVEPSDADRAAALLRVNTLLRGEVESARALYASARSESAQLRQALASKQSELGAKEDEISRLADALAAEQEKAVRAMEEYAASLRQKYDTLFLTEKAKRLRLLTYFFGGLGALCSFGGILLAAFSSGRKLLIGSLLFFGGGMMAATAVFITEPWFPYAYGVASVCALAGIGVYLWRQSRDKVILEGSLKGVQDIRDALDEKGNAVWDDIEAIKRRGGDLWDDFIAPHFKYRFKAHPGVNAEIDSRLVEMGTNSPS